jgi:thiamine biosynthesis lipoprotein
MGKEQAVDYWRSHSDMFEMILLDDDGSLYVSEGLYASFTSDMEIQIIEKDGE